MGLIEMMAQDSSRSEGGGINTFFDSPIAQILMPRTAARFQEARRQNYLLAQAERKQALAMQFAQSIAKTDPQAAAMIMADPSTMDNVFTAYYNANKQKEMFGLQQQAKLEEEQRKLEAYKALETFKAGLLPAEVTQHQGTMESLIQEAVAPKGVMADPKVQGPRPADQLQQGQTDPNTALTVATLAKQTGIPDLTVAEAAKIALDPKALIEIKKDRADRAQREQSLKITENQLASTEEGRRTQTVNVLINGVEHTVGWNPDTKRFDVDMGPVKPNATATELGARTITKLGPDGKEHIYSFNPDTKRYDIDQGMVAQKYGTPVYDADGITILRWEGGPPPPGNKPTKPTESEQKGISLFESVQDHYAGALSGFDELSTMQNRVAGMFTGPGTGNIGRWFQSGEGQAAQDQLRQLSQNYIYALSGQQAPEQEVTRILSLVEPSPSDKAPALANKKAMISSMMKAIAARLPSEYRKKDGGADLDAFVKAQGNAPKWDGTKTVPLPTPDEAASGAKTLPMPKELLDLGYSQEQWNSLSPDEQKAFIGGSN